MLKTAVFVLGILLAATVSAQSTQPAPDTVVYQKKTHVEFEPQDINGSQAMPEGSLVKVRKRVLFDSAINLRGDFRDKLLSSVYEL